ncbi:CsbD family protein [Streptomyces sp. NPDC002888]|uniref:CsbD family protein n=1 Tax=Streptomyces sp. NPDC002888 TaxID=3364668 RepID=UPI0036BBE20E
MARKGGTDKIKGKAKEMTGKVTGDREKEAEGHLDQARGEAKKTMGKAQETARSERRDRT